MRICSLVVELE